MHNTYTHIISYLLIATYSLSFQKDGIMDDDSVNVYAKLKMAMPTLERFTVCTWVKFHFEVSEQKQYFSIFE